MSAAPAATLAAWLLSLGVAAGGGYWLADSLADARVASLQARAAADLADLERNARVRLAAAQVRGDDLTRALHQARTDTATLRDELDHALQRQTTGRRCLDDGALRLLDRAAGARVPAPAGGAAAADAGGAAADPAHATHATDTHVARWANDAYARYAECADRLDALIAWHAEQP